MDEYNIIDTYINKLLPPKELLQGNQRIFRYKAGAKQIGVSLIHLSRFVCLVFWFVYLWWMYVVVNNGNQWCMHEM